MSIPSKENAEPEGRNAPDPVILQTADVALQSPHLRHLTGDTLRPDQTAASSGMPLDLIEWLGSPTSSGGVCVTIAITLPTRYNPAPGQNVGALIPPYKINRIKRELCALVGGVTSQHLELFRSPLLATIVDGEWDEPNAAAPGGFTHYRDCNALRVVTNIEICQAVAIGRRVFARATWWAADLQQQALYIEVYGWGQTRHYFVRSPLSSDPCNGFHPDDADQLQH